MNENRCNVHDAAGYGCRLLFGHTEPHDFYEPQDQCAEPATEKPDSRFRKRRGFRAVPRNYGPGDC